MYNFSIKYRSDQSNRNAVPLSKFSIETFLGSDSDVQIHPTENPFAHVEQVFADKFLNKESNLYHSCKFPFKLLSHEQYLLEAQTYFLVMIEIH